MARAIFGVLAGVIIAFLSIMGSQLFSLSMFPFPEGLDPSDPAQYGTVKAHIASLPLTAFAIVISGYSLAAFFAGLVSTLIAQSKYIPALVIGGFLTLSAIANAMMTPQPIWVSIVSVLVMLPMAWLGAKMVKTPA